MRGRVLQPLLRQVRHRHELHVDGRFRQLAETTAETTALAATAALAAAHVQRVQRRVRNRVPQRDVRYGAAPAQPLRGRRRRPRPRGPGHGRGRQEQDPVADRRGARPPADPEAARDAPRRPLVTILVTGAAGSLARIVTEMLAPQDRAGMRVGFFSRVSRDYDLAAKTTFQQADRLEQR